MAEIAQQSTLFLIKNAPLTGIGPLYLRVADAIAELVQRGELSRGCAMPRVRDLAEGLDVSIVTAHHAYRVLGERGLLAGRPGVGTFVAAPPAPAADPPALDAQSLAWQESFNRPRPPTNLNYVYRLPQTVAQATYAFFSVPAYGNEVQPATKRAMRRIALDTDVGAIHPTDTQGLPELRGAVAAHLRDEGIETGADRVLVTNSVEEALVLSLLSFCHDGDVVAMEDPSQFCLVDTVRMRGVKVVGIPMDDKGMRTDLLEAVATREPIRLVVVTPRAHNPTGVELAVARRQHLMDLAAKRNWLIFECDPSAPVTHRGRPQLPLFCGDRDGRVIYARPISRALMTGAALATGRILEQLVHAKDIIDRGSDVFLQLVLKRLFDAGSIARQDQSMRRQWGDQLAALTGAVERSMPPQVRWMRARAGGSMWLTLPEGCSAEALLTRCLDKGVSFIPGRAFAVSDRHERSFRLAIGSMPPSKIMEGVKQLAAVTAQYIADAQRGKVRSPIAKVS